MEQPGPGRRDTWALRAVKRVFPRRERGLAVAAFTALWLPLALAGLRALFDGTPVAHLLAAPVDWVLLHAGQLCFGTILLSAATLYFAGGRKSGRAVAGVDRQSLFLIRDEKERRIPRGLIAEGILRPGSAPEVELHLHGGETLRLVFEKQAFAVALLDALELGPAKRRAAIALGEQSNVAWRRLFGVGGTLVGGLMLGSILLAVFSYSFPEIGEVLARSGLLIMLGATLLVLRALRYTEVTIGSDGLVIMRPFATKFVDFSRIAQVNPAGTTLVIHYRNGKVEEIRGASATAAQAAAERAQEAMEQARQAESASRSGWLERRGRSLRNWRAAVVAALRPASEYRSAAHGPDDAQRILEDPKAQAEQRVGAALALVGSGEPRAAEKVRAAAAACANTRLRVALSSAADEDADLAAIEEALAAEAKERARTAQSQG